MSEEIDGISGNLDLSELNRIVKSEKDSELAQGPEGENFYNLNTIDRDDVVIGKDRILSRETYEAVMQDISKTDNMIKRLEDDLNRARSAKERNNCRLKLNAAFHRINHLFEEVGQEESKINFRHELEQE